MNRATEIGEQAVSTEASMETAERWTKSKKQAARLKRRYAAERRFQAYGIAAVSVGLIFLAVMFFTIIKAGYPAFTETRIKLSVTLDEGVIDPAGTRDHDALMIADYTSLARKALRDLIPVSDRAERKDLHSLLSSGVDVQLRNMVTDDPELIGTTQDLWVLADGDVDSIVKGAISRETPESRRPINNRQLEWIDQLESQGLMEQQFAFTLFTEGASSYPELAGIGVAMLGSFMMMMVVLFLSLPIGVAAAVYLEEFAPTNKWTDMIEVNINNLAAVPSIVFGLLGLAVFINFMELPRSAPLVGGLVLTLMTLPTVIIATRAALKSVPPSIREAALGVGASKMQAIFHHILPLAAPGILTSIIIGLAQALGETAPLLMIGMVAFVVQYPGSPIDPATALPVQIYMWSNLPERGFVARTSAGIMVLLMFLVFMNAIAVYLRKKFERRW